MMIAMDNDGVLTGALKGPVVRPRSISSGTIQNFPIAGWRSPVARVAHNHKAESSNLSPAPNFQSSAHRSTFAGCTNAGPVVESSGLTTQINPRGPGNGVRELKRPPSQSWVTPRARQTHPAPYAKLLRRASAPVATLLRPETGCLPQGWICQNIA